MLLFDIPWIIGFEDEETNEDADEESTDEEDSTDDEDTDAEDESTDDEDDEDKPSKEDVANLREALRKSRREAKKAQRELRKATKTKPTTKPKEGEEDDEARKLREAAEESDTKVKSLATRLKNTAIDNEIVKVASSLGFRDTDEAVALVSRTDEEDWYDQDEDDPAGITLEKEEIKAAVKALAKTKPHLLKSSSEGGDTGGDVGRRRGQKELSEEKLKERYPVLGR